MENVTEEFLELYRRLEGAIRVKYGDEVGESPVWWMAHKARGYRGMREELDYCREVRNVLQHRQRQHRHQHRHSRHDHQRADRAEQRTAVAALVVLALQFALQLFHGQAFLQQTPSHVPLLPHKRLRLRFVSASSPAASPPS